MLVYDPKERYTAEECLNHPFLETFKSRPKAKCEEVFDFSFDKETMTKQALRDALFEEVESFQQKKLARPNPSSTPSIEVSSNVQKVAPVVVSSSVSVVSSVSSESTGEAMVKKVKI